MKTLYSATFMLSLMFTILAEAADKKDTKSSPAASQSNGATTSSSQSSSQGEQPPKSSQVPTSDKWSLPSTDGIKPVYYD